MNTESTCAHAFSRTHHFTSTHQKHSFSAATSTDDQQGALSDTATSWDICMWLPSSQPATRTADIAHLTPAHCSAAAVVAAATVPIAQRRGGRSAELCRFQRRLPQPPALLGRKVRARFQISWVQLDPSGSKGYPCPFKSEAILQHKDDVHSTL